MKVSFVIKIFTSAAAAVFLLLSSVLMAQGGVGEMWHSEKGLYSLSIKSELSPIPINQIHSWTLELQDSIGAPVLNADVSFDGGMPEHNHGLATAPSLVSQGDGSYLLQGLRFHMMGYWELVLTIEDDGTTDTVLITLNL